MSALKIFAGLGGEAWTPADITTKLWLDASDSSTITHVANAVSNWSDKSGNDLNFTQSSAALKPTTNTTSQNGLNTMDFAGDIMTSEDGTNPWAELHNGTDHSIYAVVKFGNAADPNAFYSLLGDNAGGSGNVGMAVFFDDRASVPRNEVMIHQVANGTVGQFPVSNTSGNAFVTPNAYHLIQVNTNPDHGTAASRSTITVDDTTSASNNANTYTPSAAASTYTFQIGAAGNNVGPLTGQIGEIIIYSGAISAGDEDNLINYLQTKWATP